MTLEQAAQIFTIVAGVAQAVLVIGVYLAWKQLDIALKDIRLRSKREAGNFAATQADIFASNILPNFGLIASDFEKFFGNKGRPLIEFRKKELSMQDIQKLKKWIEGPENKQIEVISFTNKLESFALTFTKGLADETIVFASVGKVYCEIVEELYFYYCLRRTEENPDSYCNTIELYKVWKSRFRKIKLANEIVKIEEQKLLANQHLNQEEKNSSPIVPLGVNIDEVLKDEI